MEDKELTALLEKPALAPEDKIRVSALVLEAQRLARELTADNAEVLRKLDDERRQGVERYRSVLLAANPDLPADFVKGDTYDELDQRLSALRAVQESTEKKLAATMQQQVAPVAGGHRNLDPYAGLSGQAKIAAALASRHR